MSKIELILIDFFGVFTPDLFWAWLDRSGFDVVKEYNRFARITAAADQGIFDINGLYLETAKETGLPFETVKKGIEAEYVFNHPLADILRHQRSSRKVALLSNSASFFLRETIKREKITDCFDYLFISAETGYEKPSAQAYEHALSVAKVAAEATIFIDDRPSNCAAAAKLGILSHQFVNNDLLRQFFATEGLL